MYLSILRDGDIDERLGCWVDDVKQLHYGGSIVRNGDRTVIVDKFVHATRSKSRSDCVDNHFASINVANELWYSLRRVCSFLEKDDTWLLDLLVLEYTIKRTSI